MHARAPVAVRPGIQVPGRAFAFGITSAEIERLKWLALAFMLCAHLAEYVLGVSHGWPIEVGRLAFPLFAVAFALPVARAYPHALPVAVRLLPFAIVAQCLAQPMREGFALNILFLFLAAAAWVSASDEYPVRRLLVRALCVAVAFAAEFSLPGFAFVLLLVRWFRDEDDVAPCYGAALALFVSCYFEGSYWAFGHLVPVALVAGSSAMTWLPSRRVSFLFPSLYVAQFGLFWLMRAYT